MTQNNKGPRSLLRWHIVDNIPFQTSFEGCLEKYFHNDRGTLFANTVCWYLAPDGVDPLEPTPVAERDGYYVQTPTTAGGFKVIGSPPGNVETQELRQSGQHKWENDDPLWWTGGRPGDKLEVVVPVKQAGQYQVSAVLTKAADYGIVQLYLDGQKAGSTVDLYNQGVITTEPPVPLGTHQLPAGEHRMLVEIVGANEKAIKSYMFGLDRIILTPAPAP